MIGSGVFIVAADITRQLGGAGWLLLVWILTGIITIAGAMSYGELAARLPRAGGQYVFLREAYGGGIGFLYGWTLFTVIQTGTIAAVSVAFAKFAAVLLPAMDGPLLFGVSAQQVIAIGVITFLTAANWTGLNTGRRAQNLLTATKLGTLALIVLVGVVYGGTAPGRALNTAHFWDGTPLSLAALPILGAAMVGSLFSADAWNNITFAAEEVIAPEQTVPRSLILGSVTVCLLYVAVNAVYLLALPVGGEVGAASVIGRGIMHATSDRVGTAAMQALLGESGARWMAAAIMISTFGCVNGIILAGARVYYAMARDGLFFAAAAQLNRHSVPGVALVMQGLWAAALTLSGSYGDLLDYVIFAALLFNVLTVAALFVFRRRTGEPSPFRVPGYPVVPLIYIVLGSLVMLDLLVVKPSYTWPGLFIVISGWPVYRLWARRS